MSEYLHVEKSFLDQLTALGWNAIDQGVGVIPSNPSVSLRRTFSEWPAPDCSSAGETIHTSSDSVAAISSKILKPGA